MPPRRAASAVLLSTSLACLSCSPRGPAQTAGTANDCGNDVAPAAHAELVTVAFFTPFDATLRWVEWRGSRPVEQGRYYTVVDDDGFLGTVQATRRTPDRCSMLQTEGICLGWEEWETRWVEPPSRRPRALDPRGYGLVAFGPVNARYASARRVVPATPSELDENFLAVPPAPQAYTADWTRLVAITMSDEPSAIEVWGRMCAKDTAYVRETRVIENGEPRLVHRRVVPVRTD